MHRPVATAVREAIRAVDQGQPVAGVAPMSAHLSDVLLGERFSAAMLGAMGGLGLTLAALGLYGVLALVSQRAGRKSECGWRSAPVRATCWAWSFGKAVGSRLGLGIGLFGAFAVGRLLASTLHEVSAADPFILLVVARLGAAALVACWLPARRAARVDPMTALRDGARSDEGGPPCVRRAPGSRSASTSIVPERTSRNGLPERTPAVP